MFLSAFNDLTILRLSIAFLYACNNNGFKPTNRQNIRLIYVLFVNI